MELALNNLQRLICPTTQQTNFKNVFWVVYQTTKKMEDGIANPGSNPVCHRFCSLSFLWKRKTKLVTTYFHSNR